MKIVFKHIPKTGGSSLRSSLYAALGEDAVLNCYTSKAVQLADRQIDCPLHRLARLNTAEGHKEYLREINRHLKRPEVKIAFGHALPPVGKTWTGGQLQDVVFVTMMRHPYTRLVSHYNYKVVTRQIRNIGFEKFLVDERNMGQNSKSLSNWTTSTEGMTLAEAVSLYENIDIILFYERYREGLHRLSDLLGVTLSENRHNVIQHKYLVRSSETDKLIDEIMPDEKRIYDRVSGQPERVCKRCELFSAG